MFGIRVLLRNNFLSINSSSQCGYAINRPCREFLFVDILGGFKCNFSETKRDLLLPDGNNRQSEESTTKVLKIAIIGTPNAGKSTFINQIVGRRAFAVSKKVHTTRSRARAAMNINDTQVVFLDTPGLVSQTEYQKHNLEQTFLRDGELAMTEANVIAVIHDVGNHFTRGRLDPKVLRLLHLYPWKHSVLILNKIDMIKKKRYLLELADRLSCKSVVDPEVNKSKDKVTFTESELIKEIKSQSGWPNFSQVFMVSALEGSGVTDVMEYLMQYAHKGPWMFPEETFTDQEPEKVIVDTVKARLLDNLPDEIPYNIKVQMELFHELRDGTITTVVLITCPNIRCEKMVVKQVRRIARDVEAELRSTFLTQVLVRLSVQAEDK